MISKSTLLPPFRVKSKFIDQVKLKKKLLLPLKWRKEITIATFFLVFLPMIS